MHIDFSSPVCRPLLPITMPPPIDCPACRASCRFGCLVWAAVIGCLSVSRAALAADVPDFVRDVRPILAERCFACQGPDRGTRQAGLRLDRREGAVARLGSGKVAIQPGKTSESELVGRIESTDPDLVMPPPETKKQLSTRQKEVLR